MNFLDFLKKSPTVYHAAEEIVRLLKDAGYTELKEHEEWKIKKGHGYFLARDTLVTAFKTPTKTPKKAILLATHIDSPGLRLKPHPDSTSHGIAQLNTEIYGSPLLHTWLDRDLSIAGKISYLSKKGEFQSKTIQLDHPVIIPNLAFHLDRSPPEKGFIVHKQDHLKPIFSLSTSSLEKALENECKSKILSFDLSLVPMEPPAYLGQNKEMIAGARLDNLTSAYAAVYALCKAKVDATTLPIAFFFDHEEIGSISSRGADSVFANELIQRVCFHLGMNSENIHQMKASSLCISADLAHGYHPNFSDKFDMPNAPFLGKGVVIKFNANQRYATSHQTAASILMLAEKHNIPVQKFASRSDIPAGSTVGSMMAAMTGIPTVDLGISSFAMHSIRETIATEDEAALCLLLQKAIE